MVPELIYIFSEDLCPTYILAFLNGNSIYFRYLYPHFLCYFCHFHVIAGVIMFGVTLSVAVGCVNASNILHKNLLKRVMQAPMAFFDTTPLGRIMNRFSKDLDMVDVNVPLYVRGWVFALAPVLSTIVVICYTTPIFLVVIIPIGFIYIIFMVSLKFKIFEICICNSIFVHNIKITTAF